MKARPILMSAPMVRALLDSRKTQTRRVVKPSSKWAARFPICAPELMAASHEVWWHSEETDRVGVAMCCPYGVPGDLLIVRETHYLTDDGDYEQVVYAEDAAAVAEHLAGIAQLERTVPSPVWPRHKKLRPSIHMPRWASRLTLEITDVRVERLQDISEADALAEGIEASPDDPGLYRLYGATSWDDQGVWTTDSIASYRSLWAAINGAGSWAANPWVWAVSFAVHRANVDQVLAERSAA